MKFNTVSLYLYNLRFSIIIAFFNTNSPHLNHLKFQLGYQSHPSTLVHPDTINNKKISVTLH